MTTFSMLAMIFAAVAATSGSVSLVGISSALQVGVAQVGQEHVARRVRDDQRRFASITTAWGVTPHAQNTGTSPALTSTASPNPDG